MITRSLIIKVDSEINLKQLEQSDSKDIFETIDSQRLYLGRWLPFVEKTKALSDTEGFVKSIVNAPGESFEYVFTIRKNNEFVGLIGFRGTDRINNKTEIGYWLSELYQKQGIVTKSVNQLCDFAFDEQGINRVQIKCAVKNQASNNIPVRLGFKFEGIERSGELLSGNAYTDLNVYSKLKGDRRSGN
ncbi:GNAT family N-acetyltransferase [Plebeiibacterium marinum]|uniref:GNAT family N-acetyltransferase n=1 Tax=Plebeiibacterium marinum TaxID=2992111 RepID=A0AAE3SKA0_9BACT|nr:GNAT family protein [Plebeiobacterium marinum]MCW3806288.1 GNAT family N-acetyltransferase [Plebeiobacterium marinum]